MPLFGLGTWLAPGRECYEAVKAALQAGYRLIDTAAMYGNEEQVGRAIHDSGVPRDDIYVVTKLMPDDHGAEGARAALEASLARLSLPYVDMYLIHTPRGGNVLETWKTLLAMRDEGKARGVGVSNFSAAQIAGIGAAGYELPEVNQIELHVFLPQRECVQYCNEHGIVVMGFCPLARCKRFGAVAAVAAVASECSMTEAQVMLRWSAQKGVVTIPKTVKTERIAENARALDTPLAAHHMEALEAVADGFKASSACNAMDEPWEQYK
eukprot:TRINITY_DN14849_c0_g1_i1.p2 TRINITY_DN14849_c0_g1~~TRINITY_DN14849_c0_g1_i1.p2  ORF type:complete len:304 (+),score=106.15 TRINITY_DN14849_c0_g1_i1:113-913(+)